MPLTDTFPPSPVPPTSDMCFFPRTLYIVVSTHASLPEQKSRHTVLLSEAPTLLISDSSLPMYFTGIVEASSSTLVTTFKLPSMAITATPLSTATVCPP